VSALLYSGSFWAYVGLGAISLITEELAPIGGGVAAHQGELGILQVAMSVAIGSWVSGIGLYYIGKWRGVWLRRRYPRFGRPFTRALMVVRRRPWRASLAVRYAYGLRLTLPIACGAAHIPLWAFMIGSAVSSLTWASLFTVVGWAFGRSATIVMTHVRRYEDVLALALAGLAGVLLFAYLRRSAVTDDPESGAEVDAFGHELDKMSGEFPAIVDHKIIERKP
jgi:membrane protein DedA with SNARE-associated domain